MKNTGPPRKSLLIPAVGDATEILINVDFRLQGQLVAVLSCDHTDHCSCEHMDEYGYKLCLFCDNCGISKKLPPNPTASAIAGGTILGPVVIFDDEKDLTLKDLTKLLNLSKQIRSQPRLGMQHAQQDPKKTVMRQRFTQLAEMSKDTHDAYYIVDEDGEAMMSFKMKDSCKDEALHNNFMEIVRQQTEGNITPLKKCAGCSNAGVGYPRCSGCQSIWYCSSTCQKSHWPEHKPECKAMKSMSSDKKMSDSKSHDILRPEIRRLLNGLIFNDSVKTGIVTVIYTYTDGSCKEPGSCAAAPSTTFKFFYAPKSRVMNFAHIRPIKSFKNPAIISRIYPEALEDLKKFMRGESSGDTRSNDITTMDCMSATSQFSQFLYESSNSKDLAAFYKGKCGLEGVVSKVKDEWILKPLKACSVDDVDYVMIMCM